MKRLSAILLCGSMLAFLACKHDSKDKSTDASSPVTVDSMNATPDENWSQIEGMEPEEVQPTTEINIIDEKTPSVNTPAPQKKENSENKNKKETVEVPKEVNEGPAPAPAPTKKTTDPNKVYEAVETQAQFPGGQAALMKWMGTNLRYPAGAQENGVQGRVIVKFIIEKDGSVSSPTITKGVDKELDNEALRLVRRMPKWTPAKNNGEIVRSSFILPVTFKLQ